MTSALTLLFRINKTDNKLTRQCSLITQHRYRLFSSASLRFIPPLIVTTTPHVPRCHSYHTSHAAHTWRVSTVVGRPVFADFPGSCRCWPSESPRALIGRRLRDVGRRLGPAASAPGRVRCDALGSRATSAEGDSDYPRERSRCDLPVKAVTYVGGSGN